MSPEDKGDQQEPGRRSPTRRRSSRRSSVDRLSIPESVQTIRLSIESTNRAEDSDDNGRDNVDSADEEAEQSDYDEDFFPARLSGRPRRPSVDSTPRKSVRHFKMCLDSQERPELSDGEDNEVEPPYDIEVEYAALTIDAENKPRERKVAFSPQRAEISPAHTPTHSHLARDWESHRLNMTPRSEKTDDEGDEDAAHLASLIIANKRKINQGGA